MLTCVSSSPGSPVPGAGIAGPFADPAETARGTDAGTSDGGRSRSAPFGALPLDLGTGALACACARVLTGDEAMAGSVLYGGAGIGASWLGL